MSSLTLSAHDELYVYRHGASQPDTIQLSSPMSISHSRTDLSGREHSDYVVMDVRLQGDEVRRYELAQLDSVVMQRGDQRIHLTRFVGRMGGDGAKTRRALRRTSLQGDDLMAETSDVNFFWETDDHIWLADGRQSLDTLLERSQAETAEFFFSGERLTDSEVVVYYSGTNGSSYNTVRVASSQTQDQPDNTEHIGIAGDCGTAVATRNQNENQNENSYSFMLDHKASYLCFLPYIANDLERTVLRKIVVRSDSAIAGVFTLSPEGIRPKEDTTHTVTLTTGDFVLPRVAQPTISAYMVIAPQNGSTRLTCEFTVYDRELQSTGTYTKIVDLDHVEPNMLYVIKANLNNYVVDLGLPVKFLNHNMGAYAPEEYGGYYAWGELTDKGTYNGNNSSQYALYNTYVGDDIRLTGYDVAHVRLGQNFSMPNVAEMRMLGDSCSVSVVTLNGIKGCKFTHNGNNLFLPYAGYRIGIYSYENGSKGFYYTSTRSNSKEEKVWQFSKQNNAALSISLESSPYLGKSIRPVISNGMTMTDGTLVQVTTDSVQWAPGQTTARLFATVNGYNRATTVGKTTVEAGFVVGDTPDVTLADGTRRVVAVAADGAYYDDFPDVANNREYFYRAYVKTSGDSIFYGKPLRFGRRLADLKLPSGNLWSGINIGSPTPYKDGDYYAWGETATKATYTEANAKWYQSSTYLFPDGVNNVQATRHDVAAQKWGEVWMLPDDVDLKELQTFCSFTPSTYNGMPGYIVKNKTVAGGDSLFLPLSGYRYNNNSNKFNNYTSNGYYQSSQMKLGDNRYNYYFNLPNSGTPQLSNGSYVYYGCVVRPVYKRNATAANGQPVFVRTLPARRTYDGVTETDTLRAVIRGLDIAGSDNTYGIVWWKEGATTANYQPLTAAADGHLVYDLKGQEAGATYCYAAYFDNGTDTDKFYGDTLSVTTVGLVDLGLSVKWATANVGLEADGDFYRWGSSAPYLYTTQESPSQSDIKPEDGNDTAFNLWGANYRMPSKAEFEELMNECTWTWTSEQGVTGYRVSRNGKSIFLPSRGYYTSNSSSYAWHKSWNTVGNYWTSTATGVNNSYQIELDNKSKTISTLSDSEKKKNGLCVRPVQDKSPRVATMGCQWTVFETTDQTPVSHTTAATLSGSIYIPPTVDAANVSYGFIVGRIDQVDSSTPSADREVPASNCDAQGRYSVTVQYDGSARFFRAYAKIGNDYYLGDVKAITAADLLDVEFRADNTAFNGTFTDLRPLKIGSPTTALNSDYHRYVANFTGNSFGSNTTHYYTTYYGQCPADLFKDKMADGHTLEVLFMMPATPTSTSESDVFASFYEGSGSGGSGIGVKSQKIYSSYFIGSFRENVTDTIPTKDRWYHVIASWNKSTGMFDIYVNGVLAGQKSSLTGNISLSSQVYYVVGGDVSSGTDSNHSFNGYVAFARIYDDPLTAGQVKTLYNALTK